MSSDQKRSMSRSLSTLAQSNQPMALSWHQALLLPPWLRRTSSPITIIGTPWLSIRRVAKFFTWRARKASTAASPGPSAPQFHDRFSFTPSRLPSPLAALCLPL